MSSIVNNALSGSLAARAALDATSQNIANVMTPGYTRQGALLKTVIARQAGTLSAGGGVQVASLIRFSDGYRSQQMWHAASALGHRSTSQPYLTQLEQVLGDDASSINGGLDAFFGALNAASVDPGSGPLRQQVIGAAEALTQRVNNLRQVLSTQRSAVTQQRITAVGQTNGITADIAELNQKITAAQAAEINASGLIDARDQKIDELAGLLAVQVIDQADGSRSVSLRSGQPLVIGAMSSTLEAQPQPDGSTLLKLVFAKESFTVAMGKIGGQLGGLNQMEYEVLEPLRTSIVDVARALANGANSALSAGFALDGSAGGALFALDESSTTGLLTLVPGVLAQDLGFSSDPTRPGNSDQLMALIALKSEPVAVTGLGTVLLGDANTQLVGKLGMDSQQNQASLATAQTVRNQAEESWKAASGVNSDEEAINLMQFQQMYQANLKVIAVANELFDSTLAMM